jgi:hypothetical protein
LLATQGDAGHVGRPTHCARLANNIIRRSLQLEKRFLLTVPTELFFLFFFLTSPVSQQVHLVFGFFVSECCLLLLLLLSLNDLTGNLLREKKKGSQTLGHCFIFLSFWGDV